MTHPQASSQSLEEKNANSPALDIPALLAAAGVDPAQGYQCVPATYLAQRYHPQLESNLPALITGITTTALLAKVAQTLANGYPSDHPTTIIWADAGQPYQTERQALAALASQVTLAAEAALVLPPLPPAHSFSALQEIVAHLRSPEGCPWDRAQTLASMRHDLLSECSEVLEAIDADSDGVDNGAHIAEEVGDLLMAAVLLIQIATDTGRFQLSEPIFSIVTKLRRRHPHVFGDTVVQGVETVLANWDAIKAQEKASKGIKPGHPLEGVPAALPALEKARQLQSKAAKAGLLDRTALASTNPALAALSSTLATEEALGEFLWQLVALAHQAGLNPEDALRSYLVHFRRDQGLV
jgi:tetrapyrrole methylase family protein / MazG family protein